MRKITILIYVMLLPVAAFAQDTTLTVTTDGRVGIGTTRPEARLDVAGTVLATAFSGSWDTSSSGYIRLGDLQIVWGQVAFIPEAFSGFTDVKFTFPANISFIDNNYSITATMEGNYGNAFGHIAGIFAKSTTGGEMRFKNTDNSVNTAANTTASYIAIGRWR